MPGPHFSYTANVPQSSQTIAITQTPILNNFQAINEFISVNHVGFDDANNFGKHNFTSLPFQGSDPVTTATEMAVYSKATPGGPNAAEIFYRYPSSGTVVQLSGATSGGAATNGYAYLSDTVFMKWGTATGINPSSSNVITFPVIVGTPVFTSAPISVYFTPNIVYTPSSGSTYVTSPTTTQFTLQVGSATFATSIYWMAIGS